MTSTRPRPVQVEFREEGAPPLAPEKEVRIAVVLYGGVSLAIYMYGVVRELWSLVRATAPEHASSDDPGRSPAYCLHPDSTLSGAEPVYRLLGQVLGDDGADATLVDATLVDGGPAAADAPVRTRFVVDIMSGTSAGGINAIALAMALANETDLRKLAPVWLETADIAKLLEPEESPDGEHGPRPLRSLLNSRLLYQELVEAFADLTISEEQAQQRPSRLVDDLDLAVTTTDLFGVPSSLGLDGEQVLETAHNTVFRFRYGTPYSVGDVVNDFTHEDLPFLAYSARCTSSFPLAFEPMQLDSVYPASPSPAADPGDRWRRFWRQYESESIDPQFRYRPFSDGGVLDNKPFSLATAALRQRRLDLPVERRLLYVEPSPERPPARPAGADGPSDPPTLPLLKATKMAAWDLRGAEPIRADLDRLAERNARLHEMNALLLDLELEARPDTPPDPSSDAELNAYRRLRVDLVTEHLGSVLRPVLGVDPRSAEARALDALLRAWRAGQYDDSADFLAAFDVQFELRRLTHLEQRLRTLSAKTAHGRLVRSARGVPEPQGTTWDELRSEARTCATALGRASVPLRHLTWSMQDPVYAAELARRRSDEPAAELYARLIDGLHEAREQLRGLPFARLVDAPWAEQPDLAADLLASERPLRSACDELAQVVTELVARARRAAGEAEEELWSSARESGLVPALQWYDQSFTTFDRILLPLVFGTELGEARPVQVNRISPLDSKASGKGEGTKLFGESYGHFGAFLQEDWRRLDLVSGRLDGASKIITALLPADSSVLADELIRRAHTGILTEEYGPGGLLHDLGQPPAEVDVRDAFWRLRLAMPVTHQLKRADWARHGQKVVPSLRLSLENELGDPWGARLSRAIGLAWKLYRVTADVSSAQQRARSGLEAVASRVTSGPVAVRRWITGRSR